MTDTHRQPGPDFLDSMASQSAANGLDINAAEFRQRARDWQADIARADQLDARVAELERQLRTAAACERVIADLKILLKAANDHADDALATA